MPSSSQRGADTSATAATAGRLPVLVSPDSRRLPTRHSLLTVRSLCDKSHHRGQQGHHHRRRQPDHLHRQGLPQRQSRPALLLQDLRKVCLPLFLSSSLPCHSLNLALCDIPCLSCADLNSFPQPHQVRDRRRNGQGQCHPQARHLRQDSSARD